MKTKIWYERVKKRRKFDTKFDTFKFLSPHGLSAGIKREKTLNKNIPTY